MRAAEKLYHPDTLRSHFPWGCDLTLGRFEIFEHPLYGDEAMPLAVGYSKALSRPIVFDCFISGDDDCDLEELTDAFADEEARLLALKA